MVRPVYMDVLVGDPGGHHATSVFKIARKSVRSQPCSKRNGYSTFLHFCFRKGSWSNDQNTPPRWKVLRHISAVVGRDNVTLDAPQSDRPFRGFQEARFLDYLI